MSLMRAEGGPEFNTALSELKHRGCNLLLTGSLDDTVLHRLSAELLGHAPERRARVIALVGPDVETARERLQLAAPGIEPAIVIDTVEDPRSATVEQQIQHVNGELHVRTIEQDLRVLEGAILEAISEIKTQQYPLEASELRFCFDSLSQLARTHDVDDVEEFLLAVGSGVVNARGMAHHVLREPPDSALVRRLGPYFDARLDHRIIDGQFNQRWCIPEYDVETDWFPL